MGKVFNAAIIGDRREPVHKGIEPVPLVEFELNEDKPGDSHSHRQ